MASKTLFFNETLRSYTCAACEYRIIADLLFHTITCHYYYYLLLQLKKPLDLPRSTLSHVTAVVSTLASGDISFLSLQYIHPIISSAFRIIAVLSLPESPICISKTSHRISLASCSRALTPPPPSARSLNTALPARSLSPRPA